MYRKIILFLVLLTTISCVSAVKVGYAFSGGGARGFAHIGMLKVLEENGVHPDYISGTSIGALVGGLYAMGYNATEMESLFINTNWKNIYNDNWNRNELYIGQKRWAPYGNAFFRLDDKWRMQLPQSVIVGNRINLELFRIFSRASSVQDFKELPIPFTCVATDLVSGKLRVFDSGSLMQGIRASMSIPSVLQPFPLDNTLYIDGGISQNLPGKQVMEMGADCIVGFKVNSQLRSADQLQGIIHVLDQTVNIGITSKVEDELACCSYIFEPNLDQYSASNFNNIKGIIKAGEDYSRAHIDEIKALAQFINSNENYKPTRLPALNKVSFTKIAIEGNKNISSAKVREYLGMELNHKYTTKQIIDNMHKAWNSQLFDIIYPVLEPDNNDYAMNVFVKERERKYLAMNFSYDRDDEFVAGAVLSLQNYLMSNSQLFAELKLAGKHELNIDFVKNFGEDFGIYYRLFPYINEKMIYFYNANHDKTTSARSMEYGLTSGIGLYARKSLVLEGYGFSYGAKLYRDIAVDDFSEKTESISGIGFKAYHESLDEYIYPKTGMRAFLKTSFSKKGILSDETVNKLIFDCKIYRPISDKFSTLLGIQYGSHFKDNTQSSFDPFYLGGLDCFAGFPHYEKSAPYYKLAQAGFVYNPVHSFFVTQKIQVLNYANNDIWSAEKGFILGGVLELGYMTYLGPIKVAGAFSEDNRVQYYLEIGYTNDIFHFSRR
jgi:predicted acylesterase/phospholipase RssA